jgi:heat shock protein HslJ
MRSVSRALTALTCLSVLLGCDSVADPSEGDLASRLRDRMFLAESVEGRELVAGTEIRMTFGEDELGAHAGCNHLGGPYSIDGNRLVLSGLSSTNIGCQPDLHAQDEWLAALLTGSPRLTLDDDDARLTIAGDDVQLTLLDRELASPDRPLVGTNWIGNGMGDGMSISIGPGSEEVTVEFADDGGFTVFTGCIGGEGTFTATASTISFQDLAYAEEVCSPANLAPLSRFVMSVLDGSQVSYEIEEANLEISRGSNVLMFREAD